MHQVIAVTNGSLPVISIRVEDLIPVILVILYDPDIHFGTWPLKVSASYL